jgi:hypothetical protein
MVSVYLVTVNESPSIADGRAPAFRPLFCQSMSGLSAMNASNIPLNALKERGALLRSRGRHRLEVRARAAADHHVGIDLAIRSAVEVQKGLPAQVEVRALTDAPGDIDETVGEPQGIDQVRVRHAVGVAVDMSRERRTGPCLSVPVGVVGSSPHHSSVACVQIG